MWTLGDNGAIKPSFKQFGLDNTNFTRIGWFDSWWIGDGNWYWNLFTQIWTIPSKKKKYLRGGLSNELEQCTQYSLPDFRTHLLVKEYPTTLNSLTMADAEHHLPPHLAPAVDPYKELMGTLSSIYYMDVS